MHTDAADWENLYFGSGGQKIFYCLSFKQDSLKKFTGKTLAEVAAIRKKSPRRNSNGSDRPG